MSPLSSAPRSFIGIRTTTSALVLLVIFAAGARAQDTSRVSRRDSTRTDSAARLKTVTIVATPIERAQPVSVTRIDATTVRLTPASTPYEMLRQ
jgi:hypothetical protein